MEEGIKNGIPVSFTFYVELLRNRKGWLNQEVVSLEFDHTLSFDTLKEEYSVVLLENPDQVIRTQSFGEAQDKMSRINGLAVSSLSSLQPDGEYRLRVKAKLAEKKLPLYFHYVIPFWGLWDFETDWYSVEFRY